MKGSEDLLLTFSTLGVEVAIIIFTTDIWRGDMGTNYTSTDIPGVLEQKTNEKNSQMYTYSRYIRIVFPWNIREYRITERTASSVKVRKGKNDQVPILE